MRIVAVFDMTHHIGWGRSGPCVGWASEGGGIAIDPYQRHTVCWWYINRPITFGQDHFKDITCEYKFTSRGFEMKVCEASVSLSTMSLSESPLILITFANPHDVHIISLEKQYIEQYLNERNEMKSLSKYKSNNFILSIKNCFSIQLRVVYLSLTTRYDMLGILYSECIKLFSTNSIF